jgi:hypothetical protein
MTVDVRGLLLNAAAALEAAADRAEKEGTEEADDFLYKQQPRTMAFGLRELAKNMEKPNA